MSRFREGQIAKLEWPDGTYVVGTVQSRYMGEGLVLRTGG